MADARPGGARPEAGRPDLVDRNTVYRPLAETDARVRIVYGGAGSGKSVAIAQDYIAKLSARKRRLVVFRKVARTIHGSTYTLFRDVLSAMGRLGDGPDQVRANESRMSFRFPNGSEILHAGLDDVKKTKSLAKPTDMWFEEATEAEFPADDTQEPDLAQIDLRLRGVEDGTYTLSFNPSIEALKLFEYFQIPTADLPTRSHKVFTDAGGAATADRQPSVYVQHTTYLDNPWVGDDYVAVFRRLSETMQAVYVRGELVAVDAPDQLIKYEWVKAAFERDPETAWTDGRRRMGVDVARFGDDETVIAEGEGYRLEYVETAKGQDTNETGRRVASLGRERGVPAELCAMDTVGLGAGAADTARSEGYDVTEFVAGASPVSNPPDLKARDGEGNETDRVLRPGIPSEMVFNNLRSQAWWFFREQLRAGTVSFSQDLPDDVKRKLQEDCLMPKYRTGQEKRIEVEPKEGSSKSWGLKRRLGRSTDYGDAEVERLFGEFCVPPPVTFGYHRLT